MMIKCPLCRYEFNPSAENCRSGCVFADKCNAVQCPNCHYEFVVESTLVKYVRKIFGKKQV